MILKILRKPDSYASASVIVSRASLLKTYPRFEATQLISTRPMIYSIKFLHTEDHN